MRSLYHLRFVAGLWALILFGLTACEFRASPITEYAGAQWWTGEDFENGSRFVQDGIFVPPPPFPASRTVRLKGAYVIPPLGDAHLHDVSGAETAAKTFAALRRDGIGYALSLGDSVSGRAAGERCEAAFGFTRVLRANGMITSPGGHPVMAYESQRLGKTQWSLSANEKAQIINDPAFAGDVYWPVGDADDVQDMAPGFLEQSPDVMKIILWGEKGLGREAALAAAGLARENGLRLFAHVHTAADADLAIEAGVDALAHLPGYDGSPALSGELLQAIAAADIAVIPTLGRQLAMDAYTPPAYRLNDVQAQALKTAHRDQLRAVLDHDIKVLSGFDLTGGTALDEIIYWTDIGALDPRRALNIAVRDTPQFLFPDRRVGCLSPGCEASFLALKTSPIDDFRAIRQQKEFMVHRGEPVDMTVQICETAPNP